MIRGVRSLSAPGSFGSGTLKRTVPSSSSGTRLSLTALSPRPSHSKASFAPFQDRDHHVGPGARVAVNRSTPCIPHLEDITPEVCADAPLKLPQGKHPLHDSGRPHRVATGDESTRGIDRDPALFREMVPVIYRRHEGRTALDELSTLTVPAEPHVLVGLDLRGG